MASDRPRLLLVARKLERDGEGDRRPRRALRRLQCDVSARTATRSHFMKFLEREFPSWLPRLRKRSMQKKYAPQEYANRCQGMVRVLQERYGLQKHEADAEQRPRPPRTKPSRSVFAW